jgi:predicted RNA-binding protein with PUA-like domain
LAGKGINSISVRRIPMNYWIFKCNPIIFDIDERLKNPEKITTWQVNQFKKDIKKGDRAFICRCGKNLGIIALMDVVSDPQNMHEVEHDLKYHGKPDLEKKLRVE